MTNQLNLTAENWQALALALGWNEVDQDPDPEGEDGPCLFHEELDRVWPAGDFQGAVEDLGLPDDELSELAASLTA